MLLTERALLRPSSWSRPEETRRSHLLRFELGFARQYLGQFDREVHGAIFGNGGSIIAFRVGYREAAVLAKVSFPTFEVPDLVNLPKLLQLLEAQN